MTHRLPHALLRCAVSTVVLLGAGVALPPAPVAAHAAPRPRCDGQATIVGEPGSRAVIGTSGDDVIVSNGARRVLAGAGADVVCMTGGDALVETDEHVHEDGVPSTGTS